MMNLVPVTTPLLPLRVPSLPTHQEAMEDQDGAVLDLSTRKQPPSLGYYMDPTPVVTSPGAYSPQSVSSDASGLSYNTDINSNNCKPVRPFKAFPRDPLSMTLTASVSTGVFSRDSSEAYLEFRNRFMSQVATNQGTNKNMRRVQSTKQVTDPSYWEKRRKNNEAAKRSRDARRAKEDELAVRCAFLEQENMQMKYRLAVLEEENKRLYARIYS